VQAQVLELLHDLTAERGTAILLISHDLGIMARMTRRIMVMYAGYVVESAPTVEIFAHPGHPYTAGLLRSIPRVGEAGGPLTPIAGSPPEPHQLPRGCPFAPRCAWALDVCWQEMPQLAPVAAVSFSGGPAPGGHLLACHNPVAADEVEGGKPLPPRFRPAPPPEDGLAAQGTTPRPSAGEPALLEVRDLCVHFPITRGTVFRRTVGQVRAVDGLSLNLTTAETVGLVGESGSGKTTLGRAIVGLIPPTSGTILFRGRALDAKDGGDRAERTQLQMVFQDPTASLDLKWRGRASNAQPLPLHHLPTR